MKALKKFSALIICISLISSCRAASAASAPQQTTEKSFTAEKTVFAVESKAEIPAELSDVPGSDSDETTKPYIEDTDTFQINTDLISELGMTYLQLCKKYDDHPEALYNTCHFKGGYGVYGWKSFEGTVFDDVKEAGGCNIIDGLNTYKLLRTNEPLTFDELVNNYGFVLVSSSGESEMDFRFWSEFSHPAYNDIYFSFATTEKEVIDNSTSISIGRELLCQ